MARFYDVETRRLYDIPDAELAPGMVQSQVAGIDGTVWVDVRQVKRSWLRHARLSEELRHYVSEIRRVFHEVYPQTQEEWEEGFRRDADPWREISAWLNMGRAFLQLTEGRELDEAQKKDYFAVLLACSHAPRDQVLSVVTMEAISRREAEQAIELFFARQSQ